MDNHLSREQFEEEIWSRPNWPPRLEKILVKSLIEEMKMGYFEKIPSGFNDESWDRVVKDFNEFSGMNYGKIELKKQVGMLRKRYRIVKPLYNHGGFGWDHRRKMIDVDDLIWAEYTEVHPQLKPYRRWGCPLYEDLCTIFTRPKATGRFAVSSAQVRPRGTGSYSNGRNKRQFGEPQSSGPKKRNNVGSDRSTKAASGSGSVPLGAGPAESDDPYSVVSCLRILSSMEGINRPFYNLAEDLFKNPTWRKTFLSLKDEKRLNWLKAMLYKS